VRRGSELGTLRSRLVFWGEIARATRQVGAFSFTSEAVAEAIAEPISALTTPRRVLEVGPGTGALTRSILRRLREGDRLDLCEINPTFAGYLRSELAHLTAPRVAVSECDVAELASGVLYDVIVSSLPLMNFEPDKVARILDLYSSRLAEGGTISYFDYWGREVRALVGSARERRRMRAVLQVTRAFLERHEWRRRVVLGNLPPARVYHVRREGRART
jgi:phosphatidylethanolamine/phosphatidyl-N-methylethanolamine N-methyltransferase